MFSTCRLYKFIGTDRSLLTGHNTLLLRQIARDLLHALLHRHNNTWTAFFETSRRHWWERVNSTVTEYHFSETSGLYRAQTWTDRMADRDATDCAIPPPPVCVGINITIKLGQY